MLESGDKEDYFTVLCEQWPKKSRTPQYHPSSMATMSLGFSCKTGLKIRHDVKFSAINLKVNYVDKTELR